MFATIALAAVGAAVPSVVYAQSSGQPSHAGTGPGTWEIVGTTGVSAQQMFLGTNNKVYIIDKTQNNPATINGHPAWATEYDLTTNTYRAMDVVTNTFCAGGGALGNGTWLLVGGNQAVTTGGNATIPGGPDPYQDTDGGTSMRLITPCDDQSCEYSYDYAVDRRWYPTLEPLADGSLIIIGGDLYGGYVNNEGNNNPTYEFYPSRGAPQNMSILITSLPANLYPLTWLLPSGKLFIQSNWQTELFDVTTGAETALPDVPHAVRVYPSSAATALLPLTPANNYTATIIMCGGNDIDSGTWMDPNWVITTQATSNSCVYINPDEGEDQEWHDDDNLPSGRTMGNFVILPDQTLFLSNGALLGTAGYGTQAWTKGESYADVPIYQPYIYDPSKPAGSRFSAEGLTNSTIARMYHSTSILLPDGSVFTAGSSPHADVVTTNTEYPTEYRAERFYPWYYQKTRPVPTGLPDTLSYGGKYFDVTLSATDLNQDGETALKQTKVVVIRTGYATHAINFGQRLIELDMSYTLNDDGSAVLHVAQLPPNANLFAPGPAQLYVVINGVPSLGQMVLVGNGIIQDQPTSDAAELPANKVPTSATSASVNGSSSSGDGSLEGAAVRSAVGSVATMVSAAMLMAGLAVL